MRTAIVAAVLLSAGWARADLAVPKFRLTAGRSEKLTLKVELLQTTTSNMLPAPMRQTVSHTWDYAFKVVEADAKGAVAEMLCERVRSSMNVGGKAFEYDSQKDKPDPANPASIGADLVVGAKLTLRFTADGRLDKLTGVGALLAKQPDAGEISKELGDEQFRQMFISTFLHWAPTMPMPERDGWDAELTESFGGLGVARLKMQYTYYGRHTDEKTKRGEERIGLAGKGRIEAGAGVGGIKFGADAVERDGELKYDPERAWFPDGWITQTARGTTSVASRDGAAVALKIEQIVRTTFQWAKP